MPSKSSLLTACFLIAFLTAGPGTAAPPPREWDATLSTIAFGSCAREGRDQPIWDAIVREKPDLFLFLGDTIYADTEDEAVFRKKYALLAAKPGYQKLLKTCPVLATWDDHEYGLNDAGVEYPKKKMSQRLFLEFFKEPESSPRWKREGIYDARVIGPPGKRVQVILLDTRYFRSPLITIPKQERDARGMPRSIGRYRADPNPESTILGANQWKWLEDQLNVKADLRIIASSIQVVPNDHHWEKWGNFPLERRRLFDLIAGTRAGGVVFVSGDRHMAEISRLQPGSASPVAYPVFEVTSSGLNQGGAGYKEPNRHRVGPGNFRKPNFGLIRIDWSKPDPKIALEVRDQDGQIALEHATSLRELQP